MDQLEQNWMMIKENYLLPFFNDHLFTDDELNIFAIKQEGKTCAYAYAHVQTNPGFAIDGILEFIKEARTFCEKRITNYSLTIVFNFPLYQIRFSGSLKALPKDVEYIHCDYNWFYETYKFKKQNLQGAIENQLGWERPVKKGSSYNDYDPDSEEAIMRALSRGDAEGYGF